MPKNFPVVDSQIIVFIYIENNALTRKRGSAWNPWQGHDEKRGEKMQSVRAPYWMACLLSGGRCPVRRLGYESTRTMKTGISMLCRTLSAVAPSKMSLKILWPWVPIIRNSAFSCLTRRTISSGGLP